MRRHAPGARWACRAISTADCSAVRAISARRRPCGDDDVVDSSLRPAGEPPSSSRARRLSGRLLGAAPHDLRVGAAEVSVTSSVVRGRDGGDLATDGSGRERITRPTAENAVGVTPPATVDQRAGPAAARSSSRARRPPASTTVKPAAEATAPIGVRSTTRTTRSCGGRASSVYVSMSGNATQRRLDRARVDERRAVCRPGRRAPPRRPPASSCAPRGPGSSSTAKSGLYAAPSDPSTSRSTDALLRSSRAGGVRAPEAAHLGAQRCVHRRDLGATERLLRRRGVGGTPAGTSRTASRTGPRSDRSRSAARRVLRRPPIAHAVGVAARRDDHRGRPPGHARRPGSGRRARPVR